VAFFTVTAMKTSNITKKIFVVEVQGNRCSSSVNLKAELPKKSAGKREEKGNLENIGVGGGNTLKCTLKKQVSRAEGVHLFIIVAKPWHS
jgi:hypothetical protein